MQVNFHFPMRTASRWVETEVQEFPASNPPFAVLKAVSKRRIDGGAHETGDVNLFFRRKCDVQDMINRLQDMLHFFEQMEADEKEQELIDEANNYIPHGWDKV